MKKFVLGLIVVALTAFIGKCSKKAWGTWVSPKPTPELIMARESSLAMQQEPQRLGTQLAEIQSETQTKQTQIETLRQKTSVPPIESNSRPQIVATKRTFASPFDRYVDNGDGTVTDKETHLMWKRCLEGMKWKRGNCEGTASEITWNDAMPNEQQKQWPKFAGYNDWRVPEIEQLKTLVY